MRIFRILGIVFTAIGVVGLLVAALLFLVLSNKVFVLIPLLIGLVDLGVGLGFLAYARYNRVKKDLLQRNGQRILTHLETVKMNPYRRINMRNPFNIYTSWQDPVTGQSYTFKSVDIWDDPTPYLSRMDSTIPVYIDQRNPRNYYVDLSWMPEAVV